MGAAIIAITEIGPFNPAELHPSVLQRCTLAS